MKVNFNPEKVVQDKSLKKKRRRRKNRGKNTKRS